MTKIRTLEELQAVLDSDLVWRKRELAALKSLVSAKSTPPEWTRCYIRAGIALLYAHWEGFVKAAGTAYLTYVASKRLTYRELTSNFVALAMKARLNSAKDTNRATVYTQVAEFFMTQMSDRCALPTDVDTHANLNSAVLREVLCVLGLDHREFESKALLIDERLVNARNKVAHGEHLLIDVDDFLELHSAVVMMIDALASQISNAAANRLYARTPAGGS